jgi:hypothetical protein
VSAVLTDVDEAPSSLPEPENWNSGIAPPERPRLSGDKCQCRSCGEYFNSTKAFDQHRIGDFTAGERRCMTVAGMRLAGMHRTVRGFWTTRGKSQGQI